MVQAGNALSVTGPTRAGNGSQRARPGLQRWSVAEWNVAPDWRTLVDAFFRSPSGQSLSQFIGQRLALGAVVYPAQPLRALDITPLASVRAVVLGQDPYHGAGQAEGLAFSVPDGVAAPPSLRNIQKELQRDLGLPLGHSLLPWTRQGVLLLNSCLTVEDGLPASHAGRGWETLTDQLLGEVATHAPFCVYLLWGVHAQKKAGMIEKFAAASGQVALLLRANHPSPLSANRGPLPFIGCGHFSTAAQWLGQRGHPLDWTAGDWPCPSPTRGAPITSAPGPAAGAP